MPSFLTLRNVNSGIRLKNTDNSTQRKRTLIGWTGTQSSSQIFVALAEIGLSCQLKTTKMHLTFYDIFILGHNTNISECPVKKVNQIVLIIQLAFQFVEAKAIITLSLLRRLQSVLVRMCLPSAKFTEEYIIHLSRSWSKRYSKFFFDHLFLTVINAFAELCANIYCLFYSMLSNCLSNTRYLLEKAILCLRKT